MVRSCMEVPGRVKAGVRGSRSGLRGRATGPARPAHTFWRPPRGVIPCNVEQARGAGTDIGSVIETDPRAAIDERRLTCSTFRRSTAAACWR